MAIAADRLVLDLSALPWHAERFGAGFYSRPATTTCNWPNP